MRSRPSRLGPGDWLIGAGSQGLLILLFAVNWLRATASEGDGGSVLRRSVTGWGAAHLVTGFCAVVALVGLTAFWLQLTRRSPALPTVTAVLLAPLSVVAVICLAVRFFLARPGVSSLAGSVDPLPGAYLGLASALLLACGTWLSLRRDRVDPLDAPVTIEVLRLWQ